MAVPNCFTEVRIPDTSPLIRYIGSWKVYYSSSSDSVWEAGMMGTGDSVHATNQVDDLAYFEYPGISSVMEGQVLGGDGVRYTLNGVQKQVDISRSTGNVSTWSAASGQQDVGVHTAMIEVTKSDPSFLTGVKSVSSVVGIIAETTDPNLLSCHETTFVDALQSSQPQVLPKGPWRPLNEFGGVGGQRVISYSSIVADSTASIQLFPPRGSNFISLNGTVGFAYGTYSVTVDPPLPSIFARERNGFNAGAQWAAPGQLLYYTPLNPQEQYTITVTGDTDPTKFLGLHSWMYCDYALAKNGGGGGGSGSGGGKSNVGAIAGGVVGGILGAALIALVFFLFLRKRKARSPPEEELFTVDETIDATTTPYDPPITPLAPLSPLARTEPPAPRSEEMRESVVSGSTLVPQLLSKRESSTTSVPRNISLVEHQDAGAVEPAAVEHLPPSYNPEWLATRSSTSPSDAGPSKPTAMSSPPPLPDSKSPTGT
ncbi:hypothetical protein CC85DRAFT_313748 [Cutaneotrichosporon oleaginosum]|uniref:Uncharacterized protein n=1 Tax=Cutaneotrichosporon oleaginosum TaxID=879819 RepID=A0A0J1AWL2_9TREE|nr:uncharacterized protein CC85DRAFT_313748 [Cutaneotrichosporon oleaginosum]KLT39679.1 hypothetical protein CC85DRAFT_313748 [Cutaneotrichosporon oleaginosum]TXT07014.1 hypothetical protein COLE_06345 [Cutaneotrichosporon oleaginosum]